MADSEYEVLAEAVATDAPPLRPEDLARSIRNAPTFQGDTGEELVDALVSLNATSASHRWTVEEVAQGVATSADVELGDEERSVLLTRLVRVLSSPAVSLLGKALDVVSSRPGQYHGGRLITELRPIFDGSDEEPQAIAAMVTHTLRLDYVHENFELRSLYLSLDDSDVTALTEMLRRAEGKGRTLRELIQRLDLAIYEPDRR